MIGASPFACRDERRGGLLCQLYLVSPCWNFCMRPSYLPSAMSWTSWSARLSSLALNLPKVLASHTNQSATCFKVALASSANIFM